MLNRYQQQGFHDKARKTKSIHHSTDIEPHTSALCPLVNQEATVALETTQKNAKLDPLPDLTPGRLFHPRAVYGEHFTLGDIEVPYSEWVYLACPRSQEKCPVCVRHTFHLGALVVAIDGACSNNGKTGAKSSIGVFFGQGNDANSKGLLHPKIRQTSQVAELEACLVALKTVKSVSKDPPVKTRLSSVIIKTDSEYVVRGVTEWLPKWKANGWKNCKGQPVANADYFRLVESIVEMLEKDMSIKFWLVPRGMNEMADWMAKTALR